MHKFFRTNLTYRIISILLAVTLWLWVTMDKNPSQEKVLEVPLETRNLAEDLVVAEQPDSVTIRVEGPKKIVDELTSRDVKAYVNLEKAVIGSNLITVEVIVPSGVQLVSTNPSKVSITVDHISEIQLPVDLIINGEPSPGFVKLEADLNPSQVIIQGPKSLLETVSQVFVEVNVEGATESLTEKLPIKIRDHSNRLIQDLLRTKPEYVEVYVPILKEQPSQKFLVRPSIVGKPGSGYQIKRVAVEPQMVEVFGTYQNLADIEYLFTADVDISGAISNITREVEVLAPQEGMLCIPQKVKVAVEVEPAS